jgi:hypothetical protein
LLFIRLPNPRVPQFLDRDVICDPRSHCWEPALVETDRLALYPLTA